jgi:hypothetical protein
VAGEQIHTHGTVGDLIVAGVAAASSAVGGIVGTLTGGAIGYHTVIKFDSARVVPTDTMRAPIRNSAGWSTPGQSDSTRRP